MVFDKELQVAIQAAKKAGKYLRENRGDKILIEKYKENFKNYATAQDKESDNIIIKTIKMEFPDDLILSEESTQDFSEGKRVWIIDPIDGTRNFKDGSTYFAISIALYQENEVKVGVVYAPCHNYEKGEMYCAIKGGGAFLNEKPLEMRNPNQELSSARVAVGFWYYKGEELKGPLKNFEEIINNCADFVRFGSAALDICQVAAGIVGAYCEPGLKPWDVAAGALILTEVKREGSEAGGVCTTCETDNLDLFKKVDGKYSVDILAAKNEGIHSQLQKILNTP